jgi:hypothetical protein
MNFLTEYYSPEGRLMGGHIVADTWALAEKLARDDPREPVVVGWKPWRPAFLN